MNATAVNLHIKPMGVASGKTVTMQELAVSTAAVQLDRSYWKNGTRYVVLQFRGATIRVTWDGGDPASAAYVTFPAGTVAEWSLASAAAAKFLRDASTDGAVIATPFGD